MDGWIDRQLRLLKSRCDQLEKENKRLQGVLDTKVKDCLVIE